MRWLTRPCWGAVCLTLAWQTVLWADPQEEFDQAARQFDAQYNGGNYKAAEKTAAAMVRLAEGPLEHQPELLGTALYRRAWAVHDQQRFAEAEPLYTRALAVRTSALGKDHVDVGWTVFYLGWLYDDLARYDEARSMYERALAIFESAYGREHRNYALVLNNLAAACYAQGRLDKAAELHEQALAIREKVFGADSSSVASSLSNLGCVYDDLGRFDDAERVYRRSLDIRERTLGTDHLDVATTLNNLAMLFDRLGRYAEAESLHRRALGIKQKRLEPDNLSLATTLDNLALALDHQSRYAEAEPLYRRALAIREKVLGTEHPGVGYTVNNLACLCGALGRWEEAERLHLRSLAIREKAFGRKSAEVARTLNNLASVYKDLGQFDEAETRYREALAIREEILKPDHPDLATSLNNLGHLLDWYGRFDEAERLNRQALDIREKAFGPRHPSVALSLNNLACLYDTRGHYAEAELLHRKALAIREEGLGPDHLDVAESLNNLAALLDTQNRFREAEQLHRRALEIRIKALGSGHGDVAASYNNLGEVYRRQGQLVKAEPLYAKALAIHEKTLGPNHPSVIIDLGNLALLYEGTGRYEEAERTYRRALAMTEATFGSDHPDMAIRMTTLASFCHEQGRLEEALSLVDRAVAIRDRVRAAPGERFLGYRLRALVLWDSGRKAEAVEDLWRAVQMAEQQRGHVSGGESQRAKYFGKFADAFERMVDWQYSLGHPDVALEAAERSRARTLFDQLELAGVDLLAGAPQAEAADLRRRQAEAAQRLAAVEQRLRLPEASSGLSAEQANQQRQGLFAELSAAREEVARVHNDVRIASPAYRMAVGRDFRPATIGVLQPWLAAQEAVLVEYLLGETNGYVFVIPPAGDVRLAPLAVDQNAAALLGVAPGPLAAEPLRLVLSGGEGENGNGLLGLLSDPREAAAAARRLAALWRVLLPADVRADLVSGRYRRLIVVPDGPVALLPFETLIVELGSETRYLLDVGPPISYGPSATVLLNLAERSAPAAGSGSRPVLSVGDPDLGSGPPDTGRTGNGGTARGIGPAARYRSVGGDFGRLPFSAWETTWVAEVFGKRGIGVDTLRGPEATERNVRDRLAGRDLVHFACHGLVDQSHGNLFGALALAPGRGPAADARNDGFLTLAEVFELNLSGCQLAVLSACETNCGPEQRGEGVLALSRGFLAAGSCRVVASNWLVDDRAAASLVSVFCSKLAEARAEGHPPDYAAALQSAKRWVRGNETWNNPFFWGPFVLIGPR